MSITNLESPHVDGASRSAERETLVLVLLSGGLDSAACVRHFQLAGLRVEGLFVDYGQSAGEPEHTAANRIAAAMEIRLHRMTVSPLAPSRGNIRGRNAAFVALALLAFPARYGIIALGVHAGTDYEDCTPEFIRAMQRVVDLYSSGGIRVQAPFLSWTKGQVIEYARSVGVPIAESYSCEAGSVPPCGHCISCRDMESSDAGQDH